MSVASEAAGSSQLTSWPSTPQLLASTGKTNDIGLDASPNSTLSESNNFFKSCQWSSDGTSLLTSSADNVLRTFILPPNLLESSETINLTPYHSHQLPGPCNATAFHPSFTLSTPSTAIYLASGAHLPIRLISPFSSSILASYPLVNPTTEAFTSPHSLLFDTYSTSHPIGSHFFAGHGSEISIFDLNRPGCGPHTSLKTIPSKRKKIVGGGVGFKGIVSTLACSSDSGILAAGTFTRWVGLYDSGGRGGEVGVFQLGKEDSDGAGITGLAWSRDGRYLLVAERLSDGIGVWDVRGTGRRLAWLRGRKAITQQRVGFDVLEGGVVVAGGTDGAVRAWKGVGESEEEVDQCWEFAAHSDTIASTAMHPTVPVLATCSGSRRISSKTDGITTGAQNGLKMARSRSVSSDSNDGNDSESDDEDDEDIDSSGVSSTSNSNTSTRDRSEHSSSSEDDDDDNGHMHTTVEREKPIDNTLRIWSLYPRDTVGT